MAVIIFAVMYGLLLYALLGGFLLTVCTSFPEALRDHQKLLEQAYRGNRYKVVAVILFWYVVSVASWPHMVRKYHN